MNWKICATGLLSTLILVSGAARAEGCVEGAAVGGVAGHVAGKHGTTGAVAGCAIGHHEAGKKEKKAQQANAASQPAAK